MNNYVLKEDSINHNPVLNAIGDVDFTESEQWTGRTIKPLEPDSNLEEFCREGKTGNRHGYSDDAQLCHKFVHLEFGKKSNEEPTSKD